MRLAGSPDRILRPLTPADAQALFAVQCQAYPESMVEALSLVQQRLQQAPGWSWGVADTHGLCAYLVTYPSLLGKVGPLGAAFAHTPHPDCLYLHDLALAPAYRGQGLAQALIATAHAAAQRAGWAHTALVAVQGSLPFWARHGYCATSLDAEQHAILQRYPGPADYLIHALPDTHRPKHSTKK